jgi:hypothetical protein
VSFLPHFKMLFMQTCSAIPLNPSFYATLNHKTHIAKPTIIKSQNPPRSAWARCCRPPPPDSPTFPTYEAVHWAPDSPYEFLQPRPPRPLSMRIYEAHVGMSSEEGKVNRCLSPPASRPFCFCFEFHCLHAVTSNLPSTCSRASRRQATPQCSSWR